MTKNHFIIGLGGVGGRCIAAFRRSMVVLSEDYEFLTKPTSEGGKDFRFEYLYIDSNDDQWTNDAQWKKYGKDYKLDESDFLNLKKGSSANLSFRNVIDASNIRPWVGGITESYSEKSGHSDAQGKELIGLTGANQLRRLGRVLFAMNASLIETQLRRRIENLHSGEIDFHIFCTLGGGTGSGSIVDMVTLIQELARQKRAKFNVYVYPFVASEFCNYANTGNFFENEYAALRDLNGLMVGTYEPHMVGVVGRNERFKYEDGKPPIRAIYVSSDMSKRAKLDDQIEFMARGCFDGIILRATQSSDRTVKAFTFEDISNIVGEPEGENPKRSYNFAAIGEKRWCVPTQQIKDLIKEDYTIRVLKFLRDGCSARRDMNSVRVDFSPTSDKQCRTYSVLMKERERKITSLGDVEVLKANKEDDSLTKLRERAREIASDAVGLLANPQFLNSIDAAVNRDVEEFERILKEKVDSVISWKTLGSNPWGIADVSKFLERCDNQISGWRSSFTGELTRDKSETRAQALVDNMGRREREWGKIGFLTSILTPKAADMIGNQHADCEEFIRCNLSPVLEATFDKLQRAFSTKVRSLKSKVDQAIKKMDDCIKTKERDVEKIESELRGNVDKDKSVNNEQFELDINNLQKVREAIAADEKEHQDKMPGYCDEWDSKVKSLSNYTNDRFDLFLTALDSKLYEDSESIHDIVVGNNSGQLQDVLVTSIIDRLRQIAGTDESKWKERLDPRITQFYEKFSLCSEIIPEKIDEAGGAKTPPIHTMAFGFPKDQNDPLVDYLKRRLVDQLPAEFQTLSSATSFFEHSTAGEIRVLHLPYWFPARFVTVVKNVYEIYKRTAKDEKKKSTIYFANIDDEDIGLRSSSRPSLILEASADRDVKVRVELAEKLYVKSGDEKVYVLRTTNDYIVMVLGMSREGIPNLSERYSKEESEYPSDKFQDDLGKAFRLALRAMSESEKREVLDRYVQEIHELSRLKSIEDPEVRAAIEKVEKVKRMLGLG